jgi:succinate dehydrogenase/fumarate reductase-like Fe-S protein
MSVGRTMAWLNLAYRFGTHVMLRMPRRALGRGSDAQRFRDAVLPEGYVPLEPAERALMPAAMQCVHCGLCALACPGLASAPASAWDEAWTFVAGPSRSIDRARLVADGPLHCASCDACARACPTDVPIAQIAAMLTRLAGQQTTRQETA